MKSIKNKSFGILVLIMLFIVSGCKKDLTDLNVNPNEPITTSPEYLFRYALKQGICSYNSNVNLEQWGLMNWMMYFASRGGVEQGKEYVVPSGKDAFWQEQYADALSNINEVCLMTNGKPEYANQYAAASIWRVFLFHRLTDLWGEIPYSEALQGLSNLNYTPVYDKQELIYLNMLNELKNDEEMLDPSKSFFDASADLICKGNISRWKMFANALRLRLATRIKDRLPSTYASVVLDLSTKIMISSNEESILFPFNSEKKNPVYEASFTGQAVVQNNPSKFLVDMLVNTNDPRTSILLDKSPMSVLPWIPPYKGVPNLLLTTDSAWSNYNLDGNWGDISRVGKWFLRNETPGVIISYSEVCFLKAEAALNGSLQGSAQQFFEDGVRANIHFYEVYGDSTYSVSDQTIDTYIQSLAPVSMEQIINQKWISFAFSNGYEAYAEYRRTAFPKLKKYDGSEISENDLPKRMIYPNSESTLNREHYLEAVSSQGADNEFTPIWWDMY
ncbi:MAG TPA: SusD/RagB family nutrient-binding outer membrane lipoprotein [Bacteroidales bacterium]|nr:SusD/RagB family nutrient-binding outer membrane lipoprotein [Bacteroidales bacterium]HPS15733.1 SusD/RagB family nutrient-binding outer membrane lipoprotein [Bacteroidales bacterium]